MLRIYPKLLCAICCLQFLFSCNKDDGGETYVPLEIITSPDLVQVIQGESVEIAVLSNDTNLTQQSVLSASSPLNGDITILDNGTAGVLDDKILYVAPSNFIGEDSFQYIVCNENGENCKSETVTITVLSSSEVNVDLAKVPYAKLSDYNFFQGDIKNQIPVSDVLPYEPISILFSDYAHKKRFVWMPNGEKASYVSDGAALDFPAGSVIIKTFFYENVQPENTTQILETRLMIRKEEGWVFANYIWNEDQTEATFNLDGRFVPIEWTQDGITRNFEYRIPAESECFTCHKSNSINSPIGVKPQNINSVYTFADGPANQLQKWIDFGYLENTLPNTIMTVVDYEDTTQPIDLRVRSYFDINCATCHSDGGHCNYRRFRFAFNESGLDSENLGVCVDPDTPVPDVENPKLVSPGSPENSVLFFRISTELEQLRMPLLGRQINHTEGIALVEEWINSLEQSCE